MDWYPHEGELAADQKYAVATKCGRGVVWAEAGGDKTTYKWRIGPLHYEGSDQDYDAAKRSVESWLSHEHRSFDL